MINKYDDFMKKMLEFFPLVGEKYDKSVGDAGEVLETIIMEDIFIPEILKLLDENMKEELLEQIFRYIEEVVNSDNTHLIDVLSVTLFEILGNDRKILNNARKYMGDKTVLLQIEAEKAIGRG